MAEVGLDISREYPKPLTTGKVQGAGVVITMGCGDACPIYLGKRYEDWDLPDPAGLDPVDGDSVDDCVRHADSIRRPGRENIGRMGDHFPGWLETAAASSARVRTPSLRSALDT
jgi:hypothetical protein